MCVNIILIITVINIIDLFIPVYCNTPVLNMAPYTHINMFTIIVNILPKWKDYDSGHHENKSKYDKDAIADFLPLGVVQDLGRL